MIAKPRSDCLDQLKNFCEAFAAEKLDGYVESITTHRFAAGPKEFNDAIWGTVKLQPLEVLLLDSPIIQRLRFVRQLGVVHWVYPGAVHTRFEHTLGVLRQTHELIVAINEATPAPHQPPIDINLASLLRLCALVHDVGHGVFSHVSEHVLAKRPDVRAALQRFRTQNELSKVQLSEVIAYYIVGSPSFQHLLKAALDKVPHSISLLPDTESERC